MTFAGFPAELAFRRDNRRPLGVIRVFDDCVNELDFVEVRDVKAENVKAEPIGGLFGLPVYESDEHRECLINNPPAPQSRDEQLAHLAVVLQ